MYKYKFAIFTALFLSLAFVTPSIAQSAKKADEKKMEKKEMKEMTKGMNENASLKEVKCDPACGFSVTSRDEKEIVADVKLHAKTHHHMDLTDAQVKEKIKDVK